VTRAQRDFPDGLEDSHPFSEWQLETNAISVPDEMSALLPSSRLEDMAVLGAMAALMVAYGKYPDPLSPAILQFFIHNADPRALTQAFVSEWLPELFADLRRFQEVGPRGNLESFEEFFAAFTNMELSTFNYTRTEAFHDALAVMMLYQATISFQPPRHAEIQWFLKGFSLHCSNGF
ncbi:hypothetical protein K435DRAFT_809912, partial [Dendrothele bispora CBS 962.96]